MIKASDLRIGNLVYPFDDIQLVEYKTILSDAISVSVKDFENTEHLYPIPLTEEWLVRMGFEKDGYNYWAHSDKYFELRDKAPNYCFCVNCGEYDCSEDIQYVHQLQNLYFALTGTELTIKP